MPKVTIVFNLPEEQAAYDTTNKADGLYSCLWGLDQDCRGFLKWGHKFKTADEALEWIRGEIPHSLIYDDD